jgi:hypothetical protein
MFVVVVQPSLRALFLHRHFDERLFLSRHVAENRYVCDKEQRITR